MRGGIDRNNSGEVLLLGACYRHRCDGWIRLRQDISGMVCTGCVAGSNLRELNDGGVEGRGIKMKTNVVVERGVRVVWGDFCGGVVGFCGGIRGLILSAVYGK